MRPILIVRRGLVIRGDDAWDACFPSQTMVQASGTTDVCSAYRTGLPSATRADAALGIVRPRRALRRRGRVIVACYPHMKMVSGVTLLGRLTGQPLVIERERI
jgi:hypothetical protein